MSASRRSALAVAGLVVTGVLIAGQWAITFGAGVTEAPGAGAAVIGGLGLLLYAGVGALIVHRTGNSVGWIFIAMAVVTALSFGAQDYVAASYRISSDPTWPATRWIGLLPNLGVFGPGLLPLLFLLFPTGTPPSPRWRPVILLWGAGLVLTSTWMLLRPGDVGGCLDPTYCPILYSIENPIGLPMPDAVVDGLLVLGVGALLASTALAVASLVTRYRRAAGVERQQLKWMLWIGLLLVASFAALAVIQSALPGGADQLDWLWNSFILLILLGIPVAAAFAILRYRLYDIDIVISKTLVYAGLAILIGAVYVGIVVGIGSAIGAGTDSTALQIAATALIALTFEPVRSRLQRWANRLVYGERATPYEVMASFGRRVGEVPSADEVLGDMADAAREGVGALAATVTVRVGSGTRSVTRPADVPDEGRSYEAAVTHAGEPIGELSVLKASNEPLRPAERALLDDLAGHAGLALHNVRLTAELEERAEQLAAQTEELRRSRERIVFARDAQRHRLERELRGGVGADLESIQAAIETDADRVLTDPALVAASLDGLGARANAALEELRDVARGIFPPLLADKGLAAAVEAHVRKLAIDATVNIDQHLATTRLAPVTENAAYFCLVQALQNAGRHAASAPVRVTLALDGDQLRVVVADEGEGFDPVSAPEGEGSRIMRDRMAALGGELTIESTPGHGTTVTASLEVHPLEVVS